MTRRARGPASSCDVCAGRRELHFDLDRDVELCRGHVEEWLELPAPAPCPHGWPAGSHVGCWTD